jgi:hypothetical protein
MAKFAESPASLARPLALSQQFVEMPSGASIDDVLGPVVPGVAGWVALAALGAPVAVTPGRCVEVAASATAATGRL